MSAREDLLYSAAFGFLFLILLLTYLFLTAGSLYGGKDYELLASCPVSYRTVVLSKLTGYYLIGLLITVVYMVPAMVFYALYASVSPLFYPVAVCNLLFIPMFPLAVSLVCGTAASAASARAKRSAPVQTCMLFLFVALLFLLSFAGWRQETERTGVGVLFAGMPYGRFFGRSAASPDLLIWLCFLALSAGAFCGAFYLAAALYPRLNGRAKSRAASRRAEQRKREKSASPLSALYRRELKMVFSNPTLLINVVSAGIAAVILSAVFLFVKDLFLSDAVYRGYFVLFLPIGLSGFSALSLYGATAINVEGQELWLLKSLPVPTERKLSVKYRVSLLLSLPQTLLSMTVCAVALNVSAAECLLYFAAGRPLALRGELRRAHRQPVQTVVRLEKPRAGRETKPFRTARDAAEPAPLPAVGGDGVSVQRERRRGRAARLHLCGRRALRGGISHSVRSGASGALRRSERF